ncbi:hypothetical protein HCZ30_15700 [Marivivens donghaensis]|uniref:DUF4760 domain-containing protein n=1 Tax=Marivivens donghaensis TaxID=1699413 RepID=A0ABX0W0R6_9RHOB|nr:hypothetical protein [Marivivens donghaensis]NIY73874.1 hypothetical protein [Marivivens donghaensis]
MFPQSVLIGLVVAFVGYFLQQRSWGHNKREEVRQREFEACTKTVEELARAVDKRIQATAEFVREVDIGQVSDDALERYKVSVREWMHDFSYFKSRIFHYFGHSKMVDFELKVHSSIQSVGAIALRTKKLGKDNLSAAHKLEQEDAQRKLHVARFVAYEFIAALDEMTANEQTSRVSLYDNVDAGQLDMISRVYLVKRLLNLKP